MIQIKAFVKVLGSFSPTSEAIVFFSLVLVGMALLTSLLPWALFICLVVFFN